MLRVAAACFLTVGLLRLRAALLAASARAHQQRAGQLVCPGARQGERAGEAGDPRRLDGAEQGAAASASGTRPRYDLTPPKGLVLTVASEKDGTLWHPDGEIHLSTGQWRLIDEGIFRRLANAAYSRQVAFDRVSLQPDGDRLN